MKTIKINIYTPKELWVKFWNRFFWPRRIKCAEWLGYGQGLVEHGVISDVLCKTEELGLNIDFETAVKLELLIRPKIVEAFNKLSEVITIPLELDEK